MFLDSDDLLLPKAVERLSKEINVTGSDVIISKIQTEDKFHFSYSIEDVSSVWTHGKIYRVSYLRNLKLNFIKLKTNEDLAFNAVAIKIAERKKTIGFINEELYLWRYNNNSITRQQNQIINTICQLSSDFILAINFAIKKFEELEEDIELLFPKIIGLYTHVQILKNYGKYTIEIEKIIEEIFSKERVKELIILQKEKNKEDVFLHIPQGTVQYDKKIRFEQNIQDFIFKYTNINIR